MRQRLHSHQQGFTIIELLIATTVFSSILLLLTGGLIQISRMYTRGLTSTRTQEAARSLADNIANNVRFGGGYIYTLPDQSYDGVTVKGYCIGNTRYSYREGAQADDGAPVVVADSVGICTNRVVPQDITKTLSDTSKELLPKRMQIVPGGMQISQPPSGGMVSINLTVASGEIGDDLEAGPPVRCRGGAGSEFCAVSSLTTAVVPQVGVR